MVDRKSYINIQALTIVHMNNQPRTRDIYVPLFKHTVNGCEILHQLKTLANMPLFNIIHKLLMVINGLQWFIMVINGL